MITPDWLKWIKPTPVDAEEIARAVEQFDCVVGNIRMKEKDFDAARRAKAALRAIQALPCDLKERPEAIAFMQALEFRIKWIGEPCKNPSNRPRKTNRNVCIAFTSAWLRDRGSHISGGETGTLPNLALAVWSAAGLNTTDETPKAWAQAWQRIRKEHKKICIQIEKDNREMEQK